MDDDQMRRRQDDFGSAQGSRFSSSSSPFSASEPTNDAPDADADGDDLPLWLQNFGESTSGTQANQYDTTGSSPTWSHAQPERRETGYAAAASDRGFSTTSFLTDDDLPEWLRALSTPEASPAPVTLGGGEISAMSMPHVGRVWIADHEVPEATSGGMVFASIVQTIDTRPDSRLTTRVIEPELGGVGAGAGASAGGRLVSAGAGAGAQRGSAGAAQPTATVAAPTSGDAGSTVTMVDPATEAASSGNNNRRLRLYLIAALLIMLIILAALILR